MTITTQTTGIIRWPSLAQQKYYAGMDQYTEIDELNLEDTALNEDECCRFFASYLDEKGQYVLSAEQKRRLDKSKQDIAVGLGISNDLVMSDICQWLNEE
jgi:hypothetical protein